MVLCSKEVECALNDIYFEEFQNNPNTPRYFNIKKLLFALDKTYINRKPGRYPAWKDMYEIQIGCYIFGYYWDGYTVCLEECFKEKVKESRERNVIRLTETEFMKIITECITNIIKEIA